VLGALAAVVAAAGTWFGLVAWAALSDPKSRRGAWFRNKAPDIHSSLWAAAFEVAIYAGVGLVYLAGRYNFFLGVAIFFCGVPLLVLLVRRALKSEASIILTAT
jgi:hypothetical protein